MRKLYSQSQYTVRLMHLPFSKVTKLFACGMCASHLTKNIIISDSKAACLTHKKILFFRQGKLQKTALGTKNNIFLRILFAFFLFLCFSIQNSQQRSQMFCVDIIFCAIAHLTTMQQRRCSDTTIQLYIFEIYWWHSFYFFI